MQKSSATQEYIIIIFQWKNSCTCVLLMAIRPISMIKLQIYYGVMKIELNCIDHEPVKRANTVLWNLTLQRLQLCTRAKHVHSKD